MLLKILDVGVTIHVGVRCTQVKRSSQFIEIAGVDRTVGIHIAGRSRRDVEVRHAGIDVIDVVVAVAVDISIDVGVGCSAVTETRLDLVDVIWAAITQIGGAIAIGVDFVENDGVISASSNLEN